MTDEDPMLAAALALDQTADLQTVLAAWNAATARLEQTHEALRKEVQRLSDELEIKNRELARKNRLADLGRMAAHVAHEVRNSLVPVTLYLSLLRRHVGGDPESLQIVDKIEAGFTAVDGTVNGLLHFAVDRDPQWRAFSARALIDDVLSLLAPQMAAQTIRTVVDVAEGQQMTADPDMLRRALLNLVLNALDAMPDGGTLSVSARTVAHAPGPVVELQVADTGPGLSKDGRRRAFEPFYTTKSGGTGLGLAIVYRIAEAHGGNVTAENRPGSGAVVTIYIPADAGGVSRMKIASAKEAAA
ncbi:MAG: sensor histidine kinase [Thermoguttaceae bacterium]|jgi:signal transduction histidine kinase